MIFPEDNDLGEIAQSENFLIEFYIDGLEVGESVDSVDIQTSEVVQSISISTDSMGGSVTGNYGDQFKPEPNSLSYRDNLTGEIITVDDWDELPDRNEAELTTWNAPDEITKTFLYTVIFNISGASGSRQEVKEYEHNVFGDYNTWSDQLRNYVGNS